MGWQTLNKITWTFVCLYSGSCIIQNCTNTVIRFTTSGLLQLELSPFMPTLLSMLSPSLGPSGLVLFSWDPTSLWPGYGMRSQCSILPSHIVATTSHSSHPMRHMISTIKSKNYSAHSQLIINWIVFVIICRFTTNYGARGIMDYLHGTDDMFRHSKSYDRNIFLCSLRSAREMFPDPLKTKQNGNTAMAPEINNN